MKPPSAGAAGGKVYAILKKASEEYIVFLHFSISMALSRDEQQLGRRKKVWLGRRGEKTTGSWHHPHKREKASLPLVVII
jgi:hypothetical protein